MLAVTMVPEPKFTEWGPVPYLWFNPWDISLGKDERRSSGVLGTQEVMLAF
jgi:hypothetical protein